MMYLSRLILNPRSRQVQKEVREPYQMHKTLSRGFPDLSKEEFQAARVLFRVEEEKGLCVLAQSKIAPDWSQIMQIENYLHCEPDSKAWAPQFESGQRLRFRLLANPTYRISSAAPERKAPGNAPRLGLYREAERLDWLRRQAEPHGFSLALSPVSYRKVEDRPVKFRGRDYDELTLEQPAVQSVDLNDGHRFALPSPEKSQAARAAFSAVQFDGTLVVTNGKIFAQTVENGIGPAKGFGFGLLSLARA